jgi:hypothetical protein
MKYTPEKMDSSRTISVTTPPQLAIIERARRTPVRIVAGQPIAALVVLDKTSGLLREATVSTDSRFNSSDTVTCKKMPQ